jgi:hypothetical protein
MRNIVTIVLTCSILILELTQVQRHCTDVAANTKYTRM